jgi:Domain of unknown function (DUF303).
MKTIRRPLRLWILAILPGLSLFGQTAPTNMKLFLLIGQSNMSGRGSLTDPIAAELPFPSSTAPRIWMLDENDDWVPAANPMHFDVASPGYGLASRFAWELASADPDLHVGLIPCAVGGSGIGSWEKGDPNYDRAKDRALIAQNHGQLAAILWHQGESNTTSYSTYCDRFATLIGNMKHDLGVPSIPVIAGEIGRFHSNQANINTELNKLPTRVPFCLTASSWNLTHVGDNSHFNTPSLATLGERYLDHYLAVSTWRGIEAESLSWTTSGPAIETHSGIVEASNESWIVFKATADGQWLEATTPVIPAGTYSVRVRFKRYNSRGQYQLSIDGSNQGSAKEQYASATSYFEHVHGLKTFATSGTHTIRFTATGKHASSASRYLSIDSVVLQPQ